MARSQNQVSIVFSAIDHLTGTVGKIDRNLKNLSDTFGTLGGRIKAGIQWNLIYRGIGQVNRAVDDLVSAIPNLIHRGEQWADTVDRIGDLTGMTAQQSSTLAGVATMVGVNVEGMGRNLSFLAKSAVTNGKAFKEWGVQIKDSNGHLLSSYDIFQNIRRRVAQVGAGFLSTAHAQQVFGRGTLDLMDLLQLSTPQYNALAAAAKRYGLVMTQAQVNAAEAWARQKQLMDLAITGIGSQVLDRVAPILTRLVNGITEAIGQNMDKIATFVAQVVAFIAGVIGGFLGINFNMPALIENVEKGGNAAHNAGKKVQDLGNAAKGAASGEDALTRALQRQIDAIDKRLQALDRQERKENARREQRQLLADIAAARAELEQVRSKSIFAAGMSYAEEELARQAQAGDIIEAQKKLTQAEKKLAEFKKQQRLQDLKDALQARRDALQQELSDHTKQLSKMLQANQAATSQLAAAWGKPNKGLGDFSGKVAKVSKDMEKAVQDALAFGKAFSQDIITFLFGPAKTTVLPPGNITVTTRSGGLIDGLGNVANWLQTIIPPLKLAGDNMGILAGAILAWRLGLPGKVFDWAKGNNPFGNGGGAGEGGGSGTGSKPNLPETPRTAGPGLWSTIAKAVVPAILTTAGFNAVLSRLLPPPPSRLTPQIDTAPLGGMSPSNTTAQAVAWIEKLLGINQPSGPQKPLTFRDYFNRGQNYTYPLGGPTSAYPGITPGFFGNNPIGTGPGTGSGYGNGWAALLDPVFRRYLGLGSPVVGNQQDAKDQGDVMTALMSYIQGNTAPMGDGQVGVTNADWLALFGDIGKITGVKGNLPVDTEGREVKTDPQGVTHVVTPPGKPLQTTASVKGKLGISVPAMSTTARNTGATAHNTAIHTGKLSAIQETLRAIRANTAEETKNPPPSARAGGGSGGHHQRIVIQLDRQETRRLLGGQPVNTSLRPVPGT